MEHELIIPDEGLPFKLFLFEGHEGHYMRESHWHTDVEIFAVLEGRLEFLMGEKEYHLENGDFLIINSNEIHSIQALQPNHTVVLQIPLKQFERYFTGEHFIRFASTQAEAEGSSNRLVPLMRKLYEVLEKEEIGREFRLCSIYNEILFLLVRDYRLTKIPLQDLKNNRHMESLSRIMSYMREHYREEISLSLVAETFGYAPSYLSRFFKKYIKVNFKTYLSDIRTAYAYQDLLGTDKTIGQIAMDNGFAQSKIFAKEFYKRYGILPSDLRKTREVQKNDRKSKD